MHHFAKPLSALLLIVLLVACSGTPAVQPTAAPVATPLTNSAVAPTAPAERAFPVAIENCGVTTTYDAPPERAVTLNQQSTEVMLALGLADRMVGTAYLDDTIFEPLAADYARVPVLAEKYPSLEVLLAANPDFVYAGYSSAFDDISQGAQASLREQGINTYIQPSSCKSEGAQADNVQRSAAAVSDIYAEIRQLGQIFGVPERAEQLVASIEADLDAVATALADVSGKPKAFYFAYGSDPPDTRGQFGLMTTLIDLAGGQNIFDDLAEDWTTVSWEEVVSRDAEVMVIDDFGLEASKRQAYVLENPKLSSIAAVRDQRFVVVPYSATIGGVRIGTTVRQLAEAFHPEAFGTTPATAAAGGFPLTIENCGVTQTYDTPPERAVTMNQHVTEVMLALGLQERMVGTAYLDDAMLPAFQAAYAAIPVLSDQYPALEVLLAAQPDFVYGGFRSAFSEDSGRTRAALAQNGAKSFLSTEYCADGPVTMETVYGDIRTIGAIFGVPERAEALVGAMQAQIAAVAARLPAGTAPRVFVYDSGEDAPFTAGGNGIANAIITLAGGENSFADLAETFGEPSWEEVVARDPEVILIFDYGDTSAEQKQAFLLANPALAQVSAIKNQRFAVLPLSSVVAGVRNPAAVEQVAQALFPEAFR